MTHADEAGETCAARPVIMSLAQKIMDGRERLSRIRRGRFGTDAAYLLIRYGELDDAASLALIDQTRSAEELRGAYEIAKGLRGPADIATDEDFRELSWSGWRALILADDGVRFFELIRPHIEKDGEWSGRQGYAISYHALKLLDDVPDATRARVAATAERMGEVTAALILLADQRDLTAFWAMVARHPDHEVLQRWGSTMLLGASVREQSAPIDLELDEPAIRKEWRARGFQVRRANYRLGPFAFLNIFVNTTGKEHFVSDVAASVNDAIDDGWLDPVKRPEQAIISVYRQLIERMGQKAVDEALSGFRLPPGRLGGGRAARDLIHGFIASHALRETVTGVEDVPKDPVLLAHTDFDWETWVRVALALRDGGPTVFGDGEAGIAAELAFAAGQPERAMAVIEAGMVDAARLSAFKALMIRLDQQCAAHLWQPGPRFFTFPIYRFSPAPR